MVGDIKQSIYKFRNAVPELFAGKYKTYSKKADADDRLIMLSGNYRSRACVLDSCNFFFNQLMSEELGDVDYNEDVALVTKGSFPQPEDGIKISEKSELYIIKAPVRATSNADGVEDLEKTELEANLAAKRIIELLSDENFRIVDKASGKYRRPIPGDVAILMRSPGKDAATVSEVLSKYGLATTSVGEDSIFGTVEVQTVVSILKTICNPVRDIEIIAALHSSIYGLSCDELAIIKLYSKEQHFYYCIKEYLRDHDDEISAKIKKFLDDIDYYRDLYSHESISTLIREIYDKSDYHTFVGALTDGNLKRLNLSRFFDVAIRFENNGGFDLGEFLNYVDILKQNNSISRAAVVKDALNTVKVMSFHASKGLEFPIVILLRTEKQFNFDDITKNNLIYHSELGIAFDKFDVEERIKSSSLIKSVVGNVKKNEMRSEELRLLYVAMTRAKEKLIMIGCGNESKDGDVKMQKYLLEKGDKLPIYDCKNANNTMYWLRIAALRQREFYDNYMMKSPHGKLYDDVPLDIYLWDKSEAVEYINNSYDELLEKTKLITRVSPHKEDIAEDEIMNMITYEYDRIAAYHVPSGMSISEIKKQHTAELRDKPDEHFPVVYEPPEFMRKGKKKVRGAQKGSAYHKVFENLDFDIECNDEYLDKLLKRLVKLNLLEEEEAEVIDKQKVAAFANSEMAARINKAIKVHRERDFSMTMSAAEAYDNDYYLPSGAHVIIRGVIDLYFEEEDGLVLLDYKTDKQEDADYYINTYDIQLELYKRALERSTGKKVKETYIYALNVAGGFIKM
jgi:ATP-dependent helicase/nuclease subunit A